MVDHSGPTVAFIESRGLGRVPGYSGRDMESAITLSRLISRGAAKMASLVPLVHSGTPVEFHVWWGRAPPIQFGTGAGHS